MKSEREKKGHRINKRSRPYPKLMATVERDENYNMFPEIVVLMISPSRGVVVWRKGDGDYTFQNNWDESVFVDLDPDEQIILSNE